MNEKQYHNYRRNAEELNEEIIFCCNDSESCEHYGSIHRLFTPKKARLDNGKALEMAAIFYNCGSEEIKKEVYPLDIVDTAGVWDDIDFINYLYENNYFNNYDAIITPDGAVVFDKKFMTII